MRDADLFHPTGNVPVYGFDAWSQLYTALDQVAPGTGSSWRSQPASTSDENASVRLGELIQAGTLSLDNPRQVGGLLPAMPGAYPLRNAPDQRPTLTVSLYRPTVVSDGGDIAIDRLRISSRNSSSVSGGDTTTGLSLPFVMSADDPDRNLLGATPPVLQRPVDASGFGSGVSGGRRDWLKTGSTSLPADGRGTRSYEVRADVHIEVSGPDGVRHVTGTATIRIEERDALGHGITAPRPVPQVYDLPALLTAGTPNAPQDWAATPLRDVRTALEAGVDLTDQGFQFWVATGPDPDGSRLTLALYAASRAARDNGRPVELVTRGPEGLRIWSFDPDGTLTAPPAGRTGTGDSAPAVDLTAPGTADGTIGTGDATPGTGSSAPGSTTGVAALDQAWADFENAAAAFDSAQDDHNSALGDEDRQRDLRHDAQNTLNGRPPSWPTRRPRPPAPTRQPPPPSGTRTRPNRTSVTSPTAQATWSAGSAGPASRSARSPTRSPRASARRYSSAPSFTTVRRNLAELTARAPAPSTTSPSGTADPANAPAPAARPVRTVPRRAPRTPSTPRAPRPIRPGHPAPASADGTGPAADPGLAHRIDEVTAEVGELGAKPHRGGGRAGAGPCHARRLPLAGPERDRQRPGDGAGPAPRAPRTRPTPCVRTPERLAGGPQAAALDHDCRRPRDLLRAGGATAPRLSTRRSTTPSAGASRRCAAARAAAETQLPGTTGPGAGRRPPRRCPTSTLSTLAAIASRWPRAGRPPRRALHRQHTGPRRRDHHSHDRRLRPPRTGTRGAATLPDATTSDTTTFGPAEVTPRRPAVRHSPRPGTSAATRAWAAAGIAHRPARRAARDHGTRLTHLRGRSRHGQGRDRRQGQGQGPWTTPSRRHPTSHGHSRPRVSFQVQAPRGRPLIRPSATGRARRRAHRVRRSPERVCDRLPNGLADRGSAEPTPGSGTRTKPVPGCPVRPSGTPGPTPRAARGRHPSDGRRRPAAHTSPIKSDSRTARSGRPLPHEGEAVGRVAGRPSRSGLENRTRTA
ncbi:hypothetical protein ACRAWF_43550 [Streptomyces sp. L7]